MKENKINNKNLKKVIILLVILVAVVSLIVAISVISKKDKNEEVNNDDGYNLTVNDDNPTENTYDKIEYNAESSKLLGTLEIPKIEYECTVANKTGDNLLGVIYPSGAGLNVPRSTIIIEGDYKNNLLSSKNEYLESGDKIYITDINNNKVSYTIYDRIITDHENTSFFDENIGEKAEIALSICIDNNENERIIILAKQD